MVGFGGNATRERLHQGAESPSDRRGGGVVVLCTRNEGKIVKIVKIVMIVGVRVADSVTTRKRVWTDGTR